MFYGCWCPSIFDGLAYHGKPLDEVDQICKSLSQCQKCNQMSSCSGSDSGHFLLGLDKSDDSYTCHSSSNCAKQSCECIAEFSVNLAQQILEKRMILDSRLDSVDSNFCSRKSNIPTVPNACCGTSPSWIPFDSNTKQCENGKII